MIDTDVLLDVALDRAPHADAASALLEYLEQPPVPARTPRQVIDGR